MHSNFGKMGCFKLMGYAKPRIDISKGIECGDKLIHWRGEK